METSSTPMKTEMSGAMNVRVEVLLRTCFVTFQEEEAREAIREVNRDGPDDFSLCRRSYSEYLVLKRPISLALART